MAYDGVFCTADGGRTWRMGDAGTTSIVQMQFSSATLGWAVAVDRQPAISTPSVVATGTVSSDLLLRTRDGGLHWQPIAHLAALRSISFADDQNGWAVTDQGLRVSHDGGESWTAVRLPIGFGVEPRAQGFGPPLLPANLASRQVGWLVGDGGRVVGTSDGGTSWATGWTPPFGASWTNGPVDIRFTGARIGWLLLALGQGCASQEPYALYRTDDGVQWTLSLVGEGACGIFNEPNYPTTGPFDNIGGYPEDLAALGPNRAWLAIFSPASARLAILSTRDAGKTWAQVGSIPGSFNLVGMQFVSDTEGWLITRRPPAYPRDDNRLLHTTDGGATWQRVWA